MPTWRGKSDWKFGVWTIGLMLGSLGVAVGWSNGDGMMVVISFMLIIAALLVTQ